MPTRCTEAATCSGIRNSGGPAGKPDKPDRTSGPPPALLRPSRSPKSPRPECASEPPWGLAAAIGLRFRFGVKIGILRAIGVPAGGGRLALLIARKTAIAAASAEIAALDAEWIISCRSR